MTKELKIATDNFDQTNTFNVEVRGRLDTNTIKCQLRQNYQKQDDGIYWAMSVGAMIKDSYTEMDKAETVRLYSEDPVRNGDTVIIEGKNYKAKVLGAYSDACIFEEIN